jgi:hypothetical protein
MRCRHQGLDELRSLFRDGRKRARRPAHAQRAIGLPHGDLEAQDSAVILPAKCDQMASIVENGDRERRTLDLRTMLQRRIDDLLGLL